MIRFNELIGVNRILGYISLTTLFISGLGALYECDLKRVIALSTLRQLGVMVFSLSLGLWEIAFFHLIRHAIFKSLLFLCAGVYIHSFNDTQDIRGLGKNLFSYPLTSIYFLGCSLSICGFPFLSGFYSKDLILEGCYFTSTPLFMLSILIPGVIFTIIYSLRLISYMFIKDVLVSATTYREKDLYLIIPISVLYLVSVVIGSLFVWVYLPPGVEQLSLIVKTLVLVISVLILGLWVIGIKVEVYRENIIFKVLSFTGGIWFLPNLTTVNFIEVVKEGKSYFKFIDTG